MPERYKAGGNLSADGENTRLGERAAAASGWVCVPVLQERLRGKNMNQYDYSNLATYTALSRIERETCNRKNESASRPLVYICSPYSHGCINDNIENARRYSRFAVDTHDVPITPHFASERLNCNISVKLSGDLYVCVQVFPENRCIVKGLFPLNPFKPSPKQRKER